MVQDFINKQFLNLLIFTLTFGIMLYDLIGFDFVDEICALFLFILFGYYLFKTPNWKFNKAFLITLGIFLFYLGYSFFIKSNVPAGILTDFVIQIKPYLAFFCVYAIMPVFTRNQKVILKFCCLLFWIILLILGVIELFSPGIINDIMGHVAYYAAAVVSVSLLYLYATDFKISDKIMFLLILSAGIISGRSKFYGFFVFATVFIIYFSNLKHLKLNFKTVFIGLCMLAVIFVVAYEKLELYFIQNITADDEQIDLIARFVLYATSIDLFVDYFPFGTGFGSFATYASGLYYSDLYADYGIDKVWGMNSASFPFIADTYYPSLAQFGIIGVILYITFWLYIVVKAYSFFKVDRNRMVQYFLIVLLITGFFGIEGTSDSTFTAHRGFFILMVLGLSMSQMKSLALEKKKSESVNILQNPHESTANK